MVNRRVTLALVFGVFVGLHQVNAPRGDVRTQSGPSAADFRDASIGIRDAHLEQYRREHSLQRVDVPAAPSAIPASVAREIDASAQKLVDQAQSHLAGRGSNPPMTKEFAEFIRDNPELAKHFVNGYGEERGFQPIGVIERARAEKALERASEKAELLLDLHEAGVPYRSRDFQNALRSFRAANAELRTLTGEGIDEVAHTSFPNRKNRELLAAQFAKFDEDVLDRAAIRAQEKRMREVKKFELSDSDSYMQTAAVTGRSDMLAATARGVSREGTEFADQHRAHKLAEARNRNMEAQEQRERERVDERLRNAERLAAIRDMPVRRDSLPGQIRSNATMRHIDRVIEDAPPRSVYYDSTGSDARYQQSLENARADRIRQFTESRNQPVHSSLSALRTAVERQAQAEARLEASSTPGTEAHRKLEKSLQSAQEAVTRAQDSLVAADRQIQRAVEGYELAKRNGTKFNDIDPTKQEIVVYQRFDLKSGVTFREMYVRDISSASPPAPESTPLTRELTSSQVGAVTALRNRENSAVAPITAARDERTKIDQELSTATGEKREQLLKRKSELESELKESCSTFEKKQGEVNDLRRRLENDERPSGYEHYDPEKFRIAEISVPTGVAGVSFRSFRIVQRHTGDTPTAPLKEPDPAPGSIYGKIVTSRVSRAHFSGAITAYQTGGQDALDAYFTTNPELAADAAEAGISKKDVAVAIRKLAEHWADLTRQAPASIQGDSRARFEEARKKYPAFVTGLISYEYTH